MLSLDFIAVDRSLWAFFENVQKNERIQKTAYIADVMMKTRNTTDVLLKKFFILAGLATDADMADYYRSRTDPARFDAWVAELRANFRDLLFGRPRGAISPGVVKPKFVDVRVFTAKMIAKYVCM